MGARGALLGTTLLAVVMAGGHSPVARANAGHSCSVGTLQGLYIFAATGWGIVPGTTPVPDPLPPKAIVEWIHFDGNGTLDSPGATLSLNGKIAEAPGGTTGTYTVVDLPSGDKGCSGKIAFSNGPTFDVFFGAKGGVISMIQTNDHNVFRGTATKVSR